MNAFGFEVLHSMIWDVTPCSSVKLHRRFGGTYRLHFQRWKESKTRNELPSSLRVQNIFWHWRRKLDLALKCWNSTGLHDVTAQKLYLFLIGSAEITSDPATVKIFDAKILYMSCDTVWSGRTSPMFRMNLMLSSSGQKNWKWQVPPKRWSFTRIHSVTSQKTIF
jgi:hypothetical protein